MMDDTKYVDLTKEQWEQVLEKVASNETAMFIIRSWANSQTVSWGSISAFEGKVVESEVDRKAPALTIGRLLTQPVQAVTGDKLGRCYIWNKNAGEWSIGYNQTYALRQALGHPGQL